MPHFSLPGSVLLLLALAGPAPVGAQASPFLATVDPRLPLIEHLIARGEIKDPSPLERPFRRGDLVLLLGKSSSAVAKQLAAELAVGRRASWHSLAIKFGPQAYSQGRRDLLQDGDKGNPGLYAEFDGEAVYRSVVFAGRTALDTRLSDDPDYVSHNFLFGRQRDGRIIDMYLELQRPWGSVHVGWMARNWGPVGIPGVPLSDASYSRPDIGLTLGRGSIRFSSVATKMRSSTSTAGGKIERYYLAHRLAVRAGRDLTVAAWEIGLIAGAANQMDGPTRAIVPLLVMPALVASKGHRNEMVGLDISWRPAPRLRLEAQVAIDDWNFGADNPYPQRWAGSVSGAGALGKAASWRARYTTASSLAFRTLYPVENIADQGIGIGRLFPDNEMLEFSVDVPVRETWLVSPRLALLRQGEGRIESPYPAFAEASSVPPRFIGTVATSYWAGLGISGWHRRLQLTGEGGLRHTNNAGHVAGRTSTTLEGRLTATIGFTLWKADQ